MKLNEIIAAWNAKADDSNSWHHLGEDEKLEWAMKLEREACAKVVEDLRGQCWAYDHDQIATAIRTRGNT